MSPTEALLHGDTVQILGEANKVSVAGKYFLDLGDGGKRGLKGTDSEGGRMFIFFLL